MNNAAAESKARQVLVVDDDLTIRLLARKTLEKEGFIVHEAADGKEALAAFQHAVPDLILLDVMMPGIDGYTVCRTVRAHPTGRNTAILMITGLDDVDSIQKAYEVGATDFITKPVNWSILAYRAHYMIKASQTVQDLSRSETLLSSAQRIARLGSWDCDLTNGVFHCSDELYRIFNIPPATFDGTYRTFLDIIHPADKEEVQGIMEDSITSQMPFRIDHKILLADGSERFVHTEAEFVFTQDGSPARLTGTTQDITERKQAEEQIRLLALYDNLTGLPNRVLFNDRLEQALRHAARYGTLLAVIFIDLNNFKDVNDGLGHTVGDILLREVAQRLLSAMREADTVARLGGDEFTIFTQNITSLEGIYTIAQKIVDLFTEPFLPETQNLFISTSIGIATYPNDGKTVEELLKRADTAMYHAKEHGDNRYELFSVEMQVKADARLTMYNELRRALERNEFVLHYQPKFETETGKLAGVEALVRWQHPEKGIIPPEFFIPVAESIGMIVPLGEWVLLEACRQNMAWRAMGYPPVKISVNLSPVQFQRGNIVSTIRSALGQTGMDPRMLEIEIRENTLMQECEAAMEDMNHSANGFFSSQLFPFHKRANPVIVTLSELKKLGVSIALDNFGTGYSSLGYLSESPINVLKIDRRFVQAIKSDGGSEIILAIIALAKKLGLKVIAEGVETDIQKFFLLVQGCQEMQGYLVGKPVDPMEFVQHFRDTGVPVHP